MDTVDAVDAVDGRGGMMRDPGVAAWACVMYARQREEGVAQALRALAPARCESGGRCEPPVATAEDLAAAAEERTELLERLAAEFRADASAQRSANARRSVAARRRGKVQVPLAELRAYLGAHPAGVTVAELRGVFGASEAAVHRQLSKLGEAGALRKVWRRRGKGWCKVYSVEG